MKPRFRQSGAFILATVIFMMVMGALMMYSMANLSQVSSNTNSATANGNLALAAAQSGLKYCMWELTPTATATCTLNPLIEGVSTPNSNPCKLRVTAGCASGICTITSAACCPNANDAVHGGKKLEIKAQKTTNNIQPIPASRRVLPLDGLDSCPLP